MRRLEVNFTIHVIYTKNVHVIYHLCIAIEDPFIKKGRL